MSSKASSKMGKFELGQLVMTPGAIEVCDRLHINVMGLVVRHHKLESNCCKEDKQANFEAVENGGRIFSVYHLVGGEKLWIITEAKDDNGERESTCILTPEEY